MTRSPQPYFSSKAWQLSKRQMVYNDVERNRAENDEMTVAWQRMKEQLTRFRSSYLELWKPFLFFPYP